MMDGLCTPQSGYIPLGMLVEQEEQLQMSIKTYSDITPPKNSRDPIKGLHININKCCG